MAGLAVATAALVRSGGRGGHFAANVSPALLGDTGLVRRSQKEAYCEENIWFQFIVAANGIPAFAEGYAGPDMGHPGRGRDAQETKDSGMASD